VKGACRRVPAVLLVLVLVAAIGGGVAACASPEERVTGIVTAIDAEGLGAVRGFTLRTTQGESLRFSLGPLASDRGSFPADHLAEHLASAAPIEVRYRRDGERLVAVRLADAPA
jgi:hypothetical protein